MDRDELLKALANTAQEQAVQEAAKFDQRWDRLSRGELTAQELDDLRAEAEGSAELSAALAAFAPLDAEFQTRTTDAIMAQLAASATDDAETVATAKTQTEIPATSEADNVVVLHRQRRRTWAPVALAASVMAAVALGVFLRPGPDALMLPGYGLTLEGATKTYRGSDATLPENRFATGNRFRLLLTPQVPVVGEIETRVYTWNDTSLETLSTPAARISADGAVLVEGTVGSDVMLPPGESELVIALAQRGKLPGTRELADALRDMDSARDDHWSAWKLSVRTR